MYLLRRTLETRLYHNGRAGLRSSLTVISFTANQPYRTLLTCILSAEDLPLNVSRETLQSNRFMKQLRSMIIKRMIQLFTKIMEGEDEKKIEKMQEVFGSVIKLGAVEDAKNREKLVSLARFTTNQRNNTSFDQVCCYF